MCRQKYPNRPWSDTITIHQTVQTASGSGLAKGSLVPNKPNSTSRPSTAVAPTLATVEKEPTGGHSSRTRVLGTRWVVGNSARTSALAMTTPVPTEIYTSVGSNITSACSATCASATDVRPRKSRVVSSFAATRLYSMVGRDKCALQFDIVPDGVEPHWRMVVPLEYTTRRE